jgi:hypothetical protein
VIWIRLGRFWCCHDLEFSQWPPHRFDHGPRFNVGPGLHHGVDQARTPHISTWFGAVSDQKNGVLRK